MRTINRQMAERDRAGEKELVGPEEKLPMVQAIVLCKCPRCTRGDMFKTSALNLGQFNELREACEHCGLRYQVEPGFYQISMFFTYAVSVALIVVFGFGAYLIFNDPPLWVYYIAIFTPLILTTPWNVRYSKVMMLYFFGNVWRS